MKAGRNSGVAMGAGHDVKKASYAISLLKSWTWPTIPIGVNRYINAEKVFGKISVLEVIE